MPSSLARIHSSTLGYSPHLRVSVYGTVTCLLPRGYFSAVCLGPVGLPLGSFPIWVSELSSRIYLGGLPTPLDRNPITGWPFTPASPHRSNAYRWYGNIDPFPITYAFRPRLRGRLTLRGLTFHRKPRVFGEQVSHLLYRYLCRHHHFCFVQHLSSRYLQPTAERSPTNVGVLRLRQSAASALGLSPANYRRETT